RAAVGSCAFGLRLRIRAMRRTGIMLLLAAGLFSPGCSMIDDASSNSRRQIIDPIACGTARLPMLQEKPQLSTVPENAPPLPPVQQVALPMPPAPPLPDLKKNSLPPLPPERPPSLPARQESPPPLPTVYSVNLSPPLPPETLPAPTPSSPLPIQQTHSMP